MFYMADSFDVDLTSCVSQIAEASAAFAESSFLDPSNRPNWGDPCESGE